ncbi:hypothetical protein HB13667_08055 [Pseudomonas putida]|uniref:Uncharacterized protein n=1 Tax=Pseudomonas putida TaxID=303 RepID=A0A0P7DBC7_PSEPU|nr:MULTISPECIES: hypothetical protein [Pseudomonas]KPM66719.1 hypothetical protein HB13667_08055 [Pseudomonas putida]MDH4430900.1 hypothetical protein [Pseudomonas shirazica]WPX87675.1 hypothetical protein PsasTeo6_15056 [Pseudomonas asiatica]
MSEPSFPDARRKVVGETWIQVDKVVKETVTKNTARYVIHRTRTRAILLECGHALEVTRFKKVPTNNTICHACDLPRLNHLIDQSLRRAGDPQA